jgi:hypothetical protein
MILANLAASLANPTVAIPDTSARVPWITPEAMLMNAPMAWEPCPAPRAGFIRIEAPATTFSAAKCPFADRDLLMAPTA